MKSRNLKYLKQKAMPATLLTATNGTTKHKAPVIPPDCIDTGITVYKTKNYGMFRSLMGNRHKIPYHVKELMASMAEQNLVCPMIVNEKYEVIDGQHRLESAATLGEWIYFIVLKHYGLPEVQRLNSNQKNYSFDDLCSGYCDMNLEDYLIIRSFKDRYKFDWSITLGILSGKSVTNNKDNNAAFKSGNFKVRDLRRADNLAQKLEDFKPHYLNYTRKYFLQAAIKAIGTKGYDHRVMMHKCSYLSAKLIDCVSVADYTRLLETIYNYKSQGEDVRLG